MKMQNLTQVMGLFWQQLAGIGHDMGHSGITHNFHFEARLVKQQTNKFGELLMVLWETAA